MNHVKRLLFVDIRNRFGLTMMRVANMRRFSIHYFKITEVVMADRNHEFYSKAEDALTAHGYQYFG